MKKSSTSSTEKNKNMEITKKEIAEMTVIKRAVAMMPGIWKRSWIR